MGNLDGLKPMPVYGCGKSKEALKFYDLKRARTWGLCLDWMRNRCMYHPSECKYTHAMPPAKSEAELRKLKWRKGQSAKTKRKIKVDTTSKCGGTKALRQT